ncbi:MAG: hypothetical protein ACRCRW_15510 [Aeromonadaceae bacterium]
MFLLLSGEGPGDMGVCNPASTRCSSNNFVAGPMAVIVDQLVDSLQGFGMSHIATERVEYLSEKYLSENKPAPQRRAMFLRGKKKPAETKYYFENARALAVAAKEKSAEIQDAVIAVLFRDSDGTASAGRGDWKNKRDSMIAGFEAEDFNLGVAMVPKPKSEAWLLCSLKPNPYQHCDQLESESGNDNAENSLKQQLDELLDGNTSASDLAALVTELRVDVTRLNMPSFSAFKADLEQAVKLATSVAHRVEI